MGQVLSLEEDAHPEALGQPEALGHGRRAAAVVAQQARQLVAELGIGPGVVEPLLEFEARRHQRLGDEAASELAETAVLAGPLRAVCRAHPSLQS